MLEVQVGDKDILFVQPYDSDLSEVPTRIACSEFTEPFKVVFFDLDPLTLWIEHLKKILENPLASIEFYSCDGDSFPEMDSFFTDNERITMHMSSREEHASCIELMEEPFTDQQCIFVADVEWGGPLSAMWAAGQTYPGHKEDAAILGDSLKDKSGFTGWGWYLYALVEYQRTKKKWNMSELEGFCNLTSNFPNDWWQISGFEDLKKELENVGGYTRIENAFSIVRNGVPLCKDVFLVSLPRDQDSFDNCVLKDELHRKAKVFVIREYRKDQYLFRVEVSRNFTKELKPIDWLSEELAEQYRDKYGSDDSHVIVNSNNWENTVLPNILNTFKKD